MSSVTPCWVSELNHLICCITLSREMIFIQAQKVILRVILRGIAFLHKNSIKLWSYQKEGKKYLLTLLITFDCCKFWLGFINFWSNATCNCCACKFSVRWFLAEPVPYLKYFHTFSSYFEHRKDIIIPHFLQLEKETFSHAAHFKEASIIPNLTSVIALSSSYLNLQ